MRKINILIFFFLVFLNYPLFSQEIFSGEKIKITYFSSFQKIGKNFISLSFDKDGNIYLLSEKGEIHIYNFSGFVKKIILKGAKNFSDFLVIKDNNFIVLDRDCGCLHKFSQDGNYISTIGKKGKKEGEFNAPLRISQDGEENIYVLDTGSKKILVFSKDGEYKFSFGEEGEGAGQIKKPVDFAIFENYIYLLDGKIKKYQKDGKFIMEFSKDEILNPQTISVSPYGEIFVLDREKNEIFVFNQKGDFLFSFLKKGKGIGEIEKPDRIIFYKNYLFILESKSEKIQIFKISHLPSPPENITLEGGYRKIKITWDKSEEVFVKGYKIYRSEEKEGEYKEVSEVSENFYIDSGLENEKTYYYKISAVSEEGEESKLSDVLFSNTIKPVISTPSGLKGESGEKQIILSWENNKEEYFDYYIIYRSDKEDGEFKEIGTTKENKYIDSNLPENTVFYYKISAKSKEGEESPKTEKLECKTKPPVNIPPIEIVNLKISDVFSANYKYYVENPIGKIVLKNNTDIIFHRVKVSFFVKDFMDFPWEEVIQDFPPVEKEIEIRGVFNNKILEISEDTPVQAEIKIIYFRGGEAEEISLTRQFKIYNRNAISWDEKEKVGIFVTPKDPVVLDFSRQVVQQYSEENEKLPFNKNILIAREIFAALGTYGITYLPDPNNPYEKTSEDANLVDYVQYPRETLKRKSGDCDDLSNLYSACLESLGIDTALIDLPGHILMMFDTNLSAEEDIENFGFEKDKYIIYQEGIWIPIETTLIGSNFLKAWEEGIKLYNKWKDKAEIIYLKSVWGKYKPATLPTVFWEINSPSKEEIEKKFPNEIENLINTRLENLTKKYFEILKNNPEDIYALNQLGIIYGEYGKYDLALQKFSEILKIDINNSSAYNNMGNIYLLQGELDKAQTSYEAAKELDPEDAGILVNLAWIYYKKGEKEKAKNTFLQAIEISPSIEEEFSELKEIFLK